MGTTYNFDSLVSLYGVLPRRRRRRHRHRQLLGRTGWDQEEERPRTTTKIPDHIHARLTEVLPQLENRMDGKEHEDDGWDAMHRSLHVDVHTLDLGDGWSV